MWVIFYSKSQSYMELNFILRLGEKDVPFVILTKKTLGASSPYTRDSLT